jgi:hypothetical protein
VEDERLALEGLIALDLADDEHVVDQLDLAHVPADEMGECAAEERDARRPLEGGDARELVLRRRRELARQVVLVGGEHVDPEVRAAVEGRAARRSPFEAPEHERGLERQRAERVGGHADAPSVLGAGRDHRHSCGELPQRAAEVAGVETACLLLVALLGDQAVGVVRVEPPGEKARGSSKPLTIVPARPGSSCDSEQPEHVRLRRGEQGVRPGDDPLGVAAPVAVERLLHPLGGERVVAVLEDAGQVELGALGGVVRALPGDRTFRTTASAIASTGAPEGRRPTGRRTVGVSRPVRIPFWSVSSTWRQRSASHGRCASRSESERSRWPTGV